MTDQERAIRDELEIHGVLVTGKLNEWRLI